MKKSDLVKELRQQIAEDGDMYLLRYEVTDEFSTDARYMLSPHRRNKNGERCKMNWKEFRFFLDTLNEFEYLFIGGKLNEGER
jgi:hypothetical protein